MNLKVSERSPETQAGGMPEMAPAGPRLMTSAPTGEGLAEVLGRIGVDQRFGYKVFRQGRERGFFRYLDGKWHDVTAPVDFGYKAERVVEILQHELIAGELIVFGCCCHACAEGGRHAAWARELVASGMPEDRISHGYWPEHEEAELARMEKEAR